MTDTHSTHAREEGRGLAERQFVPLPHRRFAPFCASLTSIGSLRSSIQDGQLPARAEVWRRRFPCRWSGDPDRKGCVPECRARKSRLPQSATPFLPGRCRICRSALSSGPNLPRALTSRATRRAWARMGTPSASAAAGTGCRPRPGRAPRTAGAEGPGLRRYRSRSGPPGFSAVASFLCAGAAFPPLAAECLRQKHAGCLTVFRSGTCRGSRSGGGAGAGRKTRRQQATTQADGRGQAGFPGRTAIRGPADGAAHRNETLPERMETWKSSSSSAPAWHPGGF